MSDDCKKVLRQIVKPRSLPVLVFSFISSFAAALSSGCASTHAIAPSLPPEKSAAVPAPTAERVHRTSSDNACLSSAQRAEFQQRLTDMREKSAKDFALNATARAVQARIRLTRDAREALEKCEANVPATEDKAGSCEEQRRTLTMLSSGIWSWSDMLFEAFKRFSSDIEMTKSIRADYPACDR